jgi:hypothetical protein
VGLVLAWQHGQYGSMPFLLLCTLGYGIVAWTGLWQSRPAPGPSPVHLERGK